MTVRLGRLEAERAGQEAEIERDAEERQAGDQKAGHRAGLEGEVETAGERLGGGLRDADIGPHRDVHADESGRARKHGADGEADRRIAGRAGSQARTKMTTPTMAMVVYWRLR